MKNIKFFFFIFLFLLFNNLQAQDKVHSIVEEMPQFPDGQKAFTKYFQEHLKYPEQAKKMGIEGKVITQFVVGKEGEVRDIKVIRGIGAGCDEEAIRILRNSPKWIPGKHKGEFVNVKMQISINFKFPKTSETKKKELESKGAEIKRLQEDAEKRHKQQKAMRKQKLIFTKYVLLDEKEIKTEELQDKMNPAEELAYMYSIKKTKKASELYGKKLNKDEGVTLVYTKDFRGLRQILAKYGIILETTKKVKKLEVNLTYTVEERLQIALATSKLKKDDEFEQMQFLRDDFTKIGENKYVFEIDLEEDAKEYFLWILEPMSNTNPDPGAFHFIRLDKI